MNINKIGLMLSIVISSHCVSAHEIPEEHKRMLAEIGLGLPDSGIKILPRSMLNLPEELFQEAEKADKQRLSKGYYSKDNPRATELLGFSKVAEKEFSSKGYGVQTDSSTGLRHSIEELKISYPFKVIPDNAQIKTIGFVPQGGFHADEGGWSGAVQFFESKDIGICNYGEMNIAVSHGAIQLAQESVTYNVNNKATLVENMGSLKSGFIYNVKWFDDAIFHELECANMHYSSDIAHKVIQLANSIDSQQ